MSRREVPFAPIPTRHGPVGDDHLVEPEGPRLHQTRADNEYGALMECEPGTEPQWSREELLPLRDVIADAMEDVLTDRERYVFDMVTTERVSFSQIGLRLSLSKSQAHRIYQSAQRKLRLYLEDNPQVKEYLTR